MRTFTVYKPVAYASALAAFTCTTPYLTTRFGKIYARVAQRGRLTDLGIQTLSTEMTYFFNTVVLDLDGTSVRFEDMYHGYNSAGEASLRVTVGVVVHRLPNPENMKF